MLAENILTNFRAKVCEQISLLEEGLGRYQVLTPFTFDDGDHLAIVLRRENGHWLLTDEGHTFMHLSYSIDTKDLQSGNRRKIIENVLSVYSVREQGGELILPVYDERFGDSLYSFIQALVKISDVTYLTRERVKSTFYEDFRQFLNQAVSSDRLIFDWHHPQHDPQGMYNVDCRINQRRKPLFIYALGNDDRVRDATISLLQFEKWHLEYVPIGIFEDQETISRKVLARFSDVAEKQFSSLSGNRDSIEKYLQEAIM